MKNPDRHYQKHEVEKDAKATYRSVSISKQLAEVETYRACT